jgi:hypothetical protein
MIRSNITTAEFEKLTWMSFDSIANDINDISVTLIENGMVQVKVLGYEIKTMTVSDYNSIIK